MRKIALAFLLSSILSLTPQVGMSAFSHAHSVAPKGELKGLAPCLSWVEPGRKPWLALLCVHGLGLYNGSWEAFGKRLSPYGIAVYAIDVRGFGSWMNAKGHQQVNFQKCLNDVQDVLKSIRLANPKTPVYIMGESMGGAIALQATALYPHLIDGLISAVPAGDRFKQKRTDLTVALHMLDGYSKQFDIGKEIVDQATNSPSLRKEWETDPLSRMDLSPKNLIQFQDFMNRNHARAKEITKTPVIIFQGCLDKLVKPEGTIEIFDELKTPDKTLELVANAEHLIFEENQFDDHDIDVLTAWLDKHCKRGLSADAIANAKLADASLRLNDLESAKHHYRLAMLTAPGTALAKQINTKLLAMPKESVAPKVGESTQELDRGKIIRKAFTGPVAMPAVLYFFANWCEPCQQLDQVMDRAKSKYANNIHFVSINIDDPRNHDLVVQYAVSPIPTVIFLDSSGKVVSYTIGYNGDETIMAEIHKLLPIPDTGT